MDHFSPADIQITAAASFDPSRSDPASDRFMWTYRVAVVNRGSQSVTLRRRKWLIVEADGSVHAIEGQGVKNAEPEISPGGTLSFESACPLHRPHGVMVGSYVMESEDGEIFEVPVPAFSLDSPNLNRVLH